MSAGSGHEEQKSGHARQKQPRGKGTPVGGEVQGTQDPLWAAVSVLLTSLAFCVKCAKGTQCRFFGSDVTR